jgi:hypothetical protein
MCDEAHAAGDQSDLRKTRKKQRRLDPLGTRSQESWPDRNRRRVCSKSGCRSIAVLKSRFIGGDAYMWVRIVMRARFQQPQMGKCPGIMAATSLRPKPQRHSEADMMSKSSGWCLEVRSSECVFADFALVGHLVS